MTSRLMRNRLGRTGALLAATVIAAAAATVTTASEHQRPVLILTSTNDPGGNKVVVFELGTQGTPSLTLNQVLSTGGTGGAGGNGGILQFRDDGGAVANFGSNTITRLGRNRDTIDLGGNIALASGCTHPDSIAVLWRFRTIRRGRSLLGNRGLR